MIKTQHCPNCEAQAVEIEELRHDLERQMTIANEHVNELATFKQEVSDVMTYIKALYPTLPRNFDRFIIPKPKPDPLVEVIKAMQAEPTTYVTTEVYANRINAALEARGFEIREKGQ